MICMLRSFIPAPPKHMAPDRANLSNVVVSMERVYQVQSEVRLDRSLHTMQAALVKILVLIKEVILCVFV